LADRQLALREAAVRRLEAVNELATRLEQAAKRLAGEELSVENICQLMEATVLLEQHAFRLARTASGPLGRHTHATAHQERSTNSRGVQS
jgi:hypothetical protein